jgi:mRNA-degrading endonuclease RelE of RelBE toxin-antitoxin system
MTFKVLKLQQAQREFDGLSEKQKELVSADYRTIETKGIEFVKRRYLRNGIFEIKSDDVRSLFRYQEDRIILIGVIYEKRSRKAPQDILKLAEKD